MSVRITRVLTGAEFTKLGDDAVAAGMYRNDPRVFLPGMAWFTPWVFNPLGEELRCPVMIKSHEAPNADFLSIHYWSDWAAIRPPICVVCPNGEWWEIDRKSSNGDGWKVSLLEQGGITCHPSIVVPGYHGWLQRSVFSADIEGRGPNGITRGAA